MDGALTTWHIFKNALFLVIPSVAEGSYAARKIPRLRSG